MTASSITCPKCNMTSYNVNDIEQKYCGNCHEFHNTMGLPLMKLRVWWTTNRVQRYFTVATIEEAIITFNTLMKREQDDDTVDMNAGGLEEYLDGEWSEWYSPTGEDISALVDEWLEERGL